MCFEMGGGINFGPVVAGAIGSEERFTYRSVLCLPYHTHPCVKCLFFVCRLCILLMADNIMIVTLPYRSVIMIMGYLCKPQASLLIFAACLGTR